MDAMEIVLWTGGFIGAIIVLVIVISMVKRYVIKPRRVKAYALAHNEEIRAEFFAWFNAAESDSDLVGGFWHIPGDWVNDEVKEALEQIKLAKAREAKHRNDEVMAYFVRVESTSGIRERWNLLKDPPIGSRHYQHEDMTDMTLRDYITQGMKQYAQLLLQESREGNSQSFYELSTLLLGRNADYSFYAMAASNRFVFPDDWDAMVATFYKNPSVDQFHNQPDYAPNQILLVATEALRTRSFVEAKLVLAYCMKPDHASGSDRHEYWPYRDVVGVLLKTDLAAMVDTIHVERRLFQQQPAHTVVD
jgi:hypothetical protein